MSTNTYAIVPEPLLDILGKEIVVGSKIVMAFPWQNSAELRIGKVIQIKMNYKFSGIYRDFVEIEWENSYVEKSKVRNIHRRILVVD